MLMISSFIVPMVNYILESLELAYFSFSIVLKDFSTCFFSFSESRKAPHIARKSTISCFMGVLRFSPGSPIYKQQKMLCGSFSSLGSGEWGMEVKSKNFLTISGGAFSSAIYGTIHSTYLIPLRRFRGSQALCLELSSWAFKSTQRDSRSVEKDGSITASALPCASDGLTILCESMVVFSTH